MQEFPRWLMMEEGRGVQAYRWLVLGGLAIIGALTLRVIGQIDRTSEKLEALQIQVTTLASTSEARLTAMSERVSGHDRRLDGQDGKIDSLQQRVWQIQQMPGPPR